MSTKKDIEKIFKHSTEENDIEAIAMTSKNGVPIASYMEKKEEHESFSTLSATILGASEVIFSAFNKKGIDNIFIGSDESILLIKEATSDSVLSLMGKSEDKEDLLKMMDEIVDKVKDIGGDSSKFEVTK
ncbi:MAG: roadblock/LC7 domain-containing protein [Candidatus Saliniplasma sp.]